MTHTHTPPHPRARASRRVRAILTVALTVAAGATVAGLLALWPRTSTATEIQTLPEGGAYGRILLTEVFDSMDPVDLASATGTLLADPPREVRLQVAPELLSTLAPGQEVVALYLPAAVEAGWPEFVFVDHARDTPMTWLAALYALTVLAVARWRGLAALAGLVVAFGIVVVFTLPALLEGAAPGGVALVTGSLVMFAVLYLAHGISARTTTALLGTLVGLLLTTALAAWATGAAFLTGMTGEEGFSLTQVAPSISVQGVLLCGMVLAGAGVLNDVTITQASAVWEIHAADPAATRLQVFARAMRIGRDHIASTVYTMAFAYLGAALPLVLLMSLTDRSLGSLLTAGEVAEEVVRTLVGSVGLVLAIPITTAIAAAVVTSGGGAAPGAADDDAAPAGGVPVGSARAG